MIAHFYILSASFSQNEIFTRREIETKIKRLAEDVALIRKHSEFNILYINYDEIYDIEFLEKFTISDFLFDPSKVKASGIDRDVVNAVQNIIQKSIKTTISWEEVISELFTYTDKTNCHGLIAFNKVNGLDDNFQIIYGADGWYLFRRHFLSLYPGSPDFFIDECSIYFANLFFHEFNKKSIKQLLSICPKKLIYHLSALNDKFWLSIGNGRNRTEVLRHFSIENKLDEIASLEGNPARRGDLTFIFENIKKEKIPVYCEPHLKLCYNDNYPGDNSYSNDRRIYFHEGIKDIQDGKILIGHIGDHL